MAAIDYGTYLPPELELQKQQLNRQQEMAKALRAQGQQMSQGPAGQMVSGQYVANSPLAMLQGPVAQLVGAYMGTKGDEKSAKLATALREREMADIEKYTDMFKGREATPEVRTELAGPYTADFAKPEAVVPAKAAIAANPEQANIFAASSYSPILRQMGLKKLTEGPKWEKAEMPNPDGSVRTGWVNYNSPDPRSTFVEGGTKPAYTALEAARFTYDTGMAPPSGAPRSYVANPPVVGGNAPAVAGATYVGGVTPTGGSPVMPSVGGMRPSGMSPAAANAASKEIFVDKAKRQAEYAERAPAAIETMKQTLTNVNDLIGDARIAKDSKGKEKIDYTITVDGKQVQGKKPQAGFELAVGAGIPSWLPFQSGTEVSNFRVRLDQIKDKTFLQAFETLKGAGQITEKEGEKATSALNRMNTAQSEVEFIKAAREFEDNVQKGMEMARQRAGMPAESKAGTWRVK
jgi:hypothetical protein